MELIDEAKAKLGSYRAVAKYLGVTETFISGVRRGRRPLPSYHQAKLAELVEKNPAQAFIEAEIRAAAGKEEAANLKRWFLRVAAFIGVAFVAAGGSGSWSPISHSASASEKPGRYASAPPTNSSMRPTSRRTAGCRNRIRRWPRSQPVDRGASKRRHRRRRILPRPCIPGRFRMLG